MGAYQLIIYTIRFFFEFKLFSTFTHPYFTGSFRKGIFSKVIFIIASIPFLILFLDYG